MGKHPERHEGVSVRGLRTFAALANRDYRFLLLGVITMTAGLQMQVVARGYLTYDLTSSALRLGLVNSGFGVPMLALALFGGAMADRWRKKRIIQFAQGLGSVTAMFVAVSISTNTVTWVHLFVASFINGFIFAFMVPARTAFVPRLVPEDRVSNALALLAAAMSCTTLIAPAIGGTLYSLVGADGVYYLIAGLQFSAVLLTGFVGPGTDKAVRDREKVLHRIAEGLSYIRRTPIVAVLLVVALSTALLVVPFRSLLPVLIVDVFHRGPETLGLLLSTMGIGAIAGSLTIASLQKRGRGALLLSGGIMSGGALLVAYFLPLFGVTVVVMLVLGVSDAIRRSLNMALIIESTESQFQGRVSSVYVMNFGLMPLGTLPASAIAERYGVPFTALVLGILLVLICLIVLFTRPALRHLQ